jgi:SAM-dependent methyltransferase
VPYRIAAGLTCRGLRRTRRVLGEGRERAKILRAQAGAGVVEGLVVDLRERAGGDLRHPWEQARASFFRRLISDHVDLSNTSTVLDVGAGDGWFAHELRSDLRTGAKVVCWDVNYRSEDLSTPLGNGILRTADAPDSAFPLVLLLDVLEHIAADEEFLVGSVLPRLASGGALVASVPAYPSLYSEHDRMLQHHRRYRPAAFLGLLSRHLELVADGPLFTSLLLPRAGAVLLERAGWAREPRGVGAWGHGSGLTAAIRNTLSADARVGSALSRRGIRAPGLSWWAVARWAGAS